MPPRIRTCILAALLLAGSRLAFAADPPTAKDITDEQVVASMQKGIDFLLARKKNENWEGPHPDKMYTGGETALVLYALIHAGESLQDNPDYKAKLHWRSKEIAPVIAWLSKNRAKSTYTAALQASALTLVPKLPEEQPGEGPQMALDSCKIYLIEAMGKDGGYTYVNRLFDYPAKEPKTLAELWDAYVAAKKKGDGGTEKTLKDKIDAYLKLMTTQVGGAQLMVQLLGADLRNRRRAATGPEAAMLDAAIKELNIYSQKLPAPPPAGDKAADVASAKKRYTDLVNARKTLKLPENDKPVTKEDLEVLITTQKERVDTLEAIAKTNFTPTGDLSNGQYGALGAWALVDYGMELPLAYWQRTERFWRVMQNPDGGWPYDAFRREDGGKTTDSMGVAGIASLFVCQEFLDNELRLTNKVDKNIDAGLAWLDKAFKPDAPSMYYMYGVERVGLASGLKFFGTTNWYKEGAAGVIKNQAPDGSWSGYGPNVSTSYALLFLARGRNPVVFNKLQYNGHWNARPRNSAYVTRWMSKHLEKPINWQIVNLQVSIDEWMDAPILLITGSQDPKFTKEDLAKLRTYINAGGMIFSTADGATPAFTNIMKKYAGDLVDNKYEMRQLPKDHMLFSKEMGVDLPNPPPLIGMSNGTREIWIHSPQDVGADWQQRKFAASKNSFELASALYFYASGMASLRSKLQPLAVADTGATFASRTVELARVDYSGNADPEPGAWPRMARIARRDFKTTVNLNTVKIAALDPKKNPLAHMTGNTRITFTDEDAKALKAYLDGGGLLLVDALGGSAEFAASAQDLIKKIYPDQALAQLAPDHPIYTGSMTDGVKIGEVDFRKYGHMKLKRRVTAPALDAITVDGKTKILFSSWDITSGLLGTQTWGLIGYAPNTAEQLARNILLYRP